MQQYPFIFSDERRYRLLRHTLFWLFWWVFFGILYSYTARVSLLPDLKRLPISMVDSLFFLTAHAFLSYTLMYVLAPRFILRGKYLQAAIFAALLFLATAGISAVIGNYILPHIRFYLFDISYVHPTNAFYLLALLAGLRGAITIGGIALAIKLMKYWYVKEQRNLQLQKENAEAQLQLLRAQVHPHFLFNTLNNIYSSTQDRAPQAAQMIGRLSGLLRYMLYEGNETRVPLSRELTMLEDYIALEKIRYGNKPDIHSSLPDQTDGLYIAPLLLLPFVENCFKHGTSQVLEQPWISLVAETRNNQFSMKLMNGVAIGQQAGGPGGIGIQNVRQRLELLYPGRHSLTIAQDEEVFIVNLKLELEQPLARKREKHEMTGSYA